MRSHRTWRWRRCGSSRRDPPFGRRIALFVFVGIAGLVGTGALAQRSSVTVDRGVLDALGPPAGAADSGSRLRLHRPEQPTQRPAPPSKTAPAQASIAPPTIADPPATPTKPAPSAPAQASIAPAPPTTPSAAARPNPPAGGEAERILFQPDDANLASEAKQELDRLATRLSGDGKLYVQLVAYAGGNGTDASQARRLSLTRALAARSYLVDRGVEIKQIDVRPLGNKSEPGAAPDRIDLVIAQR